MYKKIKIEDFVKLNNPTVIDVREPYEFELGRLPKAINIPVSVMLDNYEKYLKLDTLYYIYCETNLRSSRICEFLSELGYNVCLVMDGYKGWLAFNRRNK